MATVPRRLSARHKAAAAMRAAGATYSEIAREFRVSVRTVQTWAENPDWRDLVKQLQDEYVDHAESILLSAVPDVARHITGLATGAESEHVQLGASRDILDRAGVRRPSKADEAGTILRIQLMD